MAASVQLATVSVSLLRKSFPGVSVASYYFPKSPLENTPLMENANEGCEGMLLFPAALLLPLLSKMFTITNLGADLEFWNLGGIVLEHGTFLMRSSGEEAH